MTAGNKNKRGLERPPLKYRHTVVCPTCSKPVQDVPVSTIDLMFPPDGYEALYYANGNVKFIKLDQEVI